MVITTDWWTTTNTYVWVFNTGRGLAICIRLPNNYGIIFDMGCSEDFSPAAFVRDHLAPRFTQYCGRSIAQCLLSHPHADHILECAEAVPQERNLLHPQLLTCPNDKIPSEAVDFRRLINRDNEELLRTYRGAYAKRNAGLQSIDPAMPCPARDVECGMYYMRPPAVNAVHPTDDQYYGNGLSIALYFRHGPHSILIPGDLTPDVMSPLLRGDKTIERRYSVLGQPNGNWHTTSSNQPTLRQLLGERGLSILVAPHHGLQSCYSQELFDSITGGKPILNVVSEKRHMGENDGAVHPRYQSAEGAFGMEVDNEGYSEFKYSASTRNGQHILIAFKDWEAAPHVYMRAEATDLLRIK